MLTDARIWLALALLATQTGCGTVYVAQAARGQWQVMAAREPIERVIADRDTPAALAERLKRVRAAREFAARELGLPDNRSYTEYADLRRDYVVWSVVAVPEFAVEPKEWCFPIVGCVAYRGYFNEKRAQRFAATLDDQGYDVIVNGIPAYSTLGRFADPILNTMMIYGDDELAGIVFHELAHQLVYVSGDTAFNEAFAVTVEQAGLERWLAAQGRATDAERFRARRARQARMVDAVSGYRARLAALYAEPIPDADKRARKQRLFADLSAEVDALEREAKVRSRFADELRTDPNNARLASLATYYQCVPGFERVLADVDGDLGQFYDSVRVLAQLTRAERRARLCGAPGETPIA
jgi:predicted aminopeptidase